MSTRTIDDLHEILATAYRQNWFAIFTHSEARQLLGELDSLKARAAQAEADAAEARGQLEQLQAIADTEAENANALAREGDDLVERLAKAEAMLERLRSVLEEIKSEPILAAWTANKFRDAAAQALAEMGQVVQP